jgi:preprotein translocase subunit SecF
MLACLFFLGAESIRWFILALLFGTLIGAYSSYFIAAPLLMYWKDKTK